MTNRARPSEQSILTAISNSTRRPLLCTMATSLRSPTSSFLNRRRTYTPAWALCSGTINSRGGGRQPLELGRVVTADPAESLVGAVDAPALGHDEPLADLALGA